MQQNNSTHPSGFGGAPTNYYSRSSKVGGSGAHKLRPA